MLHTVFFTALVDDNLVADCRHRLCTRALAHFVKDELCRCLCAFEHGDFDEFMGVQSVKYVIHLIVAYAVFADLEYWIDILSKTSEFCPLRTCKHIVSFLGNAQNCRTINR